MIRILFLVLSSILLVEVASAQNIKNNPGSNHANKFEQLGNQLGDINTYRTASGAPGHEYWQQQADYKINARIDEDKKILYGEETITYYNNSPDVLNYIWLQLDENEHSPTNESNYFNESKLNLPFTKEQAWGLEVPKKLEGYGCNIELVSDSAGNCIPFNLNMTMMRIDLKKVLKPKEKITFHVKWNYKIPERMKIGGRGGYEFFEEDGNSIFTISQWYPRMCVYSDNQGWNHKQFIGAGEFALVFGNFDVTMNVPADHVICATGTCSNLKEVLSPAQLVRWQNAQTSKEPVEIVTLDEAKFRENNRDTQNYKTWKFKATNVRDFAWGSSRKFVWDAMPVTINNKKIMCMSYYAKEAYGLYRKYSTKTVAHTIRTYSKYTIDYPYPVAISVEASSGMEYPMICFNYGRTDKEGTYDVRTKYGMISVIIHEVGHNFFPMIINSDERQWAWMDEGLNTFVQFLTEQEFDNNYPSSRGPAHKIVNYMRLPKDQLEPIMTNAENIIQYGSNAYGKPATALNILRETVMGRPLFDFSFKEYCRRWAFKHPSPSDFFRTMEDASSVDLDWFWRAWFFDVEPVDISLDSVNAYQVFSPNEKLALTDTIVSKSQKQKKEFDFISKIRNKNNGMRFLVDTDTSLRDFYYYYKEKSTDTSTTKLVDRYANYSLLENEEKNELEGNYFYELTFSNKGGAVSPIIIEWNYSDGSKEIDYIHAYIWRKNENKVSKNFMKRKKVTSINIDPYKETADIDDTNQSWPQGEYTTNRYEVFKSKKRNRFESEDNTNPMKKALQEKK